MLKILEITEKYSPSGVSPLKKGVSYNPSIHSVAAGVSPLKNGASYNTHQPVAIRYYDVLHTEKGNKNGILRT